MPRTLRSVRQTRLAELLIGYREVAGLTQADVAKALDRHQPFVSTIEAGQRRVDVVELLDLEHFPRSLSRCGEVSVDP